MESLYKAIGMEVLPDEYLPDDYTGPSAGPYQQIIRTYSYSINELYYTLLTLEVALRIASVCHKNGNIQIAENWPENGRCHVVKQLDVIGGRSHYYNFFY